MALLNKKSFYRGGHDKRWSIIDSKYKRALGSLNNWKQERRSKGYNITQISITPPNQNEKGLFGYHYKITATAQKKFDFSKN